MVKRAEYLEGSFSRQQPWLAQGISRRTWERRRRKISVATSAPAKGARTPRGRVGIPASKAQPWLAQGISRRTWERHRRKIMAAKGVRTLRRRDLTANVSPASKAQRAAVGPAGDVSPVPAQGRYAEDLLLLRRIHAYWDAHGMMHSDPEALPKAIHAIKVPEPFEHMDSSALGKVYRRARKRLPVGYDRYVGLIEKWDKSYDRRKARDLVTRLLAAICDRPPEILDQMFDHLAQQICDHLPKKVRRLESECERLKNDKYYIPQLRPLKTDALKEQVYAALADGPKTKSDLARMFGKPYGAISSVGLRLRHDGLVKSIWREGRFMWARASSAPLFIPARDAIVAALKTGPMTTPQLARATGKATSTVKCALHRHLLANGTVIRTKFSTYALAGTEPPYVSRGDAIVAALKKGSMSSRALAREINNPPSSLPQFLEPLLAKGTVIRIRHGIYALPGSAPVYVPTCDAIISALTKKPMTLGPLVQHVNKSTKSTRSRGTIFAVLSGLKKQGMVQQDGRGGEYRAVQRVRAVRGRKSAARRRDSSQTRVR